MELPPAEGSKEERYQRVARAVIAVLLRGGPSSLRYADVARRAGVSRPWIYKHFGRDPDALIAYAVRLFGEAFTEIDRPNHDEAVEAWRANVMEATRRGLRDTEAAPWAIELFFRFRHARDVLGEGLRDVERRHVEKFVADMPTKLRRRPDARRFAEVFAAARLGVYHSWIASDRRGDEDKLIAWLGALLDAY